MARRRRGLLDHSGLRQEGRSAGKPQIAERITSRIAAISGSFCSGLPRTGSGTSETISATH